MHDVVVIGAGPSGSTAAASLSGRGHDVAILEEHDAVGRPVHCTGLLGEAALSEFDLPQHLVLGRAETARFWGAAGRSFSVGTPRARAVVIDRAELDAVLSDRAQAAGAQLHCGWRAQSIHVDGRGVTVSSTDGRRIAARACVLACGANYRFHRSLGLGRPGMFLQSAQVESPFPATGPVEVRFGRSLAPSGFGWVVPLSRQGVSHARIGLMSESRARQRFAPFLRSLCDRSGTPADQMPAARFKILPLGPINRTFADRVVAVGDAAGLVKPTTGGGIYYGMLSGGFAAEVLDERLRGDALDRRALQPYETRWRRRLGREIDAGLMFRRLASKLSDDSIDALIELGRTNGVVPLIARTASFNWHRSAALALLGHPSVRRIVFR